MISCAKLELLFQSLSLFWFYIFSTFIKICLYWQVESLKQITSIQVSSMPQNVWYQIQTTGNTKNAELLDISTKITVTSKIQILLIVPQDLKNWSGLVFVCFN